MVGGAGLDLLFGGAGTDNLSGGAGDDLLVAGLVAFENDLSALADIGREWRAAATDYFLRIEHLTGGTAGGQNGTTVLASPAVADEIGRDVLSGGAGRDWYLASLLDLVNGLAGDEVRTGL